MPCNIKAWMCKRGTVWRALKDGLRYEAGWLMRFGAATPARRRNLPLTLAIHRVVLQVNFIFFSNTACRWNRLHYGGVLLGRRWHLVAGVTPVARIAIAPGRSGGLGVQQARTHGTTRYTGFPGTCRHTPRRRGRGPTMPNLGQGGRVTVVKGRQRVGSMNSEVLTAAASDRA